MENLLDGACAKDTLRLVALRSGACACACACACRQPQPQPNIPGGGVYYGQGGAGNPAAHVPPTQGPPAYSAVVPAATHGSHRTAPPPAAPAPAPSTARWGPWLSSHSPQAPPAPAEPPGEERQVVVQKYGGEIILIKRSKFSAGESSLQETSGPLHGCAGALQLAYVHS